MKMYSEILEMIIKSIKQFKMNTQTNKQKILIKLNGIAKSTNSTNSKYNFTSPTFKILLDNLNNKHLWPCAN